MHKILPKLNDFDYLFFKGLLELISRNLCSFVLYWFIPEGVYRLLKSIRNFLRGYDISPNEKDILKRNEIFHNRHKGQRCFIIATGPSIAKQDLSPLKNELCISVSNAFVHPLFSEIKPLYHCIAPYHPPITEDAFQEWLNDMSSHLGHASVFFGISDKERVEKTNRFGNGAYYLKFGADSSSIVTHGIKLDEVLLAPQSVTIIALQLAIAMGCNPIYLLGCDHDWILHFGESKHFYDEKKHVMNNYGYDEWFCLDFSSHCSDYVTLWNQYKTLKEVSSQKCIKIYNSTEGGVLDVFELLPLKKILFGVSFFRLGLCMTFLSL